MFEIIKSGGWVMVPILLCSVVALAIIGERFWTLQRKRISPPHLVAQVWHWVKHNQVDAAKLDELRKGSPLGCILAAGIANLRHDREIMKEAIEDAGRHVVLELERFLNTLGTIAAISPLLGLLGTVTGIIKAFNAITQASGAMGNPTLLAGGIAEALITTAAGLIVAIPSLIAYRYLRGRVDELVALMEQDAIKLVDVVHGHRERDADTPDEPIKPRPKARVNKA